MEDFSLANLLALLVDLQFWSFVGGGLVIWYVFSCLLARAFFGSGQEPENAITKATFLSAVITACVTALAIWIILQSILATIVILALLILLPLLIMLLINRIDSARKGV
jgi:F0F1-type ATP synthase assembly protein I